MKEKIQALYDALQANANADWSENDPAGEFQILAEDAKAILDSYDQQKRLENLANFTSFDTQEELEAALVALEAQAEIDESVLADYVDGINMTEACEFSFTVGKLLDSIG
jgi:uncharacterized membrane-anchored protein